MRDRTSGGRVMRAAVVAAIALCAGVVAGVLLERIGLRVPLPDTTSLRLRVATLRDFGPDDRPAADVAQLAGRRVMVALVFGQSNAANGGETAAGPHPGVYAFHRGRLTEARDPLPGADGDRGSVWMRLAALLRAEDGYDAVVLVPFAFSTSAIADWKPGGVLHEPLLRRIDDATAHGLRFTHLLWHQGEADARAGTDEASYRAGFLALMKAIRARGIDAPVYVPLATRCGRTQGNDAVRAAQGALPDRAQRILAGPDTDTIGRADRHDGCHFADSGLAQAARLWQEALRKGP